MAFWGRRGLWHLKFCPQYGAMNPLVITGIMAMTVLVSVLMISFSDGQIRYSQTAQKVSSMQAERVREDVSVSLQDDGRLLLENTGSVPVRIVEIRVLDGDGQMVSRQRTDVPVSPAGSDTAGLDPDTAEALLNGTGRG